MGKASRDKGYRGERNLVNMLKTFAFDEVERVPLSGASRFSKSNKGDIIFRKLWDTATKFFRGEVKLREDGFIELYKWLTKEPDTNVLFIKADNKPYLVVMTLDEFVGLCERRPSTDIHFTDDQTLNEQYDAYVAQMEALLKPKKVKAVRPPRSPRRSRDELRVRPRPDVSSQ